VLNGVLARDPFDAANDAELLAAVLRGRFHDECLGDPFAHARRAWSWSFERAAWSRSATVCVDASIAGGPATRVERVPPVLPRDVGVRVPDVARSARRLRWPPQWSRRVVHALDGNLGCRVGQGEK